jgi:hypothetical protein
LHPLPFVSFSFILILFLRNLIYFQGFNYHLWADCSQIFSFFSWTSDLDIWCVLGVSTWVVCSPQTLDMWNGPHPPTACFSWPLSVTGAPGHLDVLGPHLTPPSPWPPTYIIPLRLLWEDTTLGGLSYRNLFSHSSES